MKFYKKLENVSLKWPKIMLFFCLLMDIIVLFVSMLDRCFKKAKNYTKLHIKVAFSGNSKIICLLFPFSSMLV